MQLADLGRGLSLHSWGKRGWDTGNQALFEKIPLWMSPRYAVSGSASTYLLRIRYTNLAR